MENWLIVPEFGDRYEFSDQFRVRRKARVSSYGRGGFARNIAEKMLSVRPNNGFLVTWLVDPITNEPKKFYVEAAVEQHFGVVAKQVDLSSLPGEEWRDIPDSVGYQISNLGRLKRVSRYVRGAVRRFDRAKIFTGSVANNGYMRVELVTATGARETLIHRIVAQVFVPNPLNLDVVHHIDENQLNNRADNLEWTTRGGNVQDWFDRRRIVVSVETIQTIIAAHQAGKPPAEILAGLPRRRKGE